MARHLMALSKTGVLVARKKRGNLTRVYHKRISSSEGTDGFSVLNICDILFCSLETNIKYE